MKLKHIAIATLCVFGLTAESCDNDARSTGEQRERDATKQLQDQASTAVGTPAVSNFAEKRQLKAIYEMRDNAKLVTYTYIRDLNGKRHTVCPTTSVGFGIPYSTQFTAPERPLDMYHGAVMIPMPEPNALYMPPSSEATWVLCLAPDGKTLAPAYIEPRIEVYLFEMPHAD